MRKPIAIAIATSLALAAGSLNSAAATTYVVQTVDYPGAEDWTALSGITDEGLLLGDAYTASYGGFLFAFDGHNGGFRRLAVQPPPPYDGLSADGINASGTIIGSVSKYDPRDYYFSSEAGAILKSGKLTLFSRPQRQLTEARGLNDAGLVTGYAENVSPCKDYPGCYTVKNQIGFIYDPAKKSFTDIPAPHGTDFIVAQGINARNQVVGSVYDNVGTYGFHQLGFLRDPNTSVHLFQVNNNPTAARAINDAGVIAGFVWLAGSARPFVSTSTGFQVLPLPLDALKYSRYSPGAYAEGMNNLGQIVGYWDYQTPDYVVHRHGFIAYPAVLPVGIQPLVGYVFSTDVIANTPVFIDPKVAQGYDYSSSSMMPFATVRLPIGIGDNQYSIVVGGKSYSIAGGELFDFRSHGFPSGAVRFRVKGIEASAGLSPGDSSAFVTEVTFTTTGKFKGSMLPLCAVRDELPDIVTPCSLDSP